MATNVNVYEAMYIFDSNRFARERAGLAGEIETMIKEAGGEVLVTRLWEERRLAYAIKGHRKGTYWLIYFRSPSSALSVLSRQYDLHDGILRHLTLKIHPHLVEAVLEHAKAGPAPPAAAPVHTMSAAVAAIVPPDLEDLGN